MTHDNSRGTLYYPATNTDFNMGKVISEDVSLKAGLFNKSLPLTTASLSILGSVFGRTRVVLVRGIKFGTQVQIEAFLKQFTDHVDTPLLSNPLSYYPLFHPSNTAGEGLQNAFYNVMVNDFSHRAELTNAGFAVSYEVELFQGKSISGGNS